MPTTGEFSGLAAHRAVEGGVAEGEHTTVGGHQPVAAGIRPRHADHRRVEWLAAHRAVEARRHRRRTPRRPRRPASSPPPSGVGGHPDDRRVQRDARRGSRRTVRRRGRTPRRRRRPPTHPRRVGGDAGDGGDGHRREAA